MYLGDYRHGAVVYLDLNSVLGTGASAPRIFGGFAR